MIKNSTITFYCIFQGVDPNAIIIGGAAIAITTVTASTVLGIIYWFIEQSVFLQERTGPYFTVN